MDKSQTGRAGELAVELYALVTSGGEIDIYSPVVDDDHVDLVAGLRGGAPALGIQVKTTPSLDRSGLVEARASYPAGHIREDSNFLYAVVLLNSVRIEAIWLIKSAEFNRLVYHVVEGARVVLEFRARPTGDDAFARYRIDPLKIGPAIVSAIRESPGPPAWLAALARR